MNTPDAIVMPLGTSLEDAAIKATQSGLRLYMTRGGVFVAAAKRVGRGWICCGLAVKVSSPEAA
jgi:hypothetical protein